MAISTRGGFLLWNGIELLVLIMAWIACIVSFSSPLHNINGYDAYWNRASGGGFTSDWANGTKCAGTGAAFLAMMIFAFLAFTICIIAMLVRIFHAGYSISALRLEVLTFFIGMLFFFIAVPIWSGCVNETEQGGGKANFTGYGYDIAVDIFLFIGAFAVYRIWSVEGHQMYGKSVGGGMNSGATIGGQPAVMV